MNKIWYEYPLYRPVQEGYYAIIQKFGDITTTRWKDGKFIVDEYLPNEKGNFSLKTHAIRWAYLEDVIPEDCRQGFIWEERGEV